MTINRIKEVALAHFALNGYEGASLAHIAKEVGIKKPSIYAHFKGKDDLFLAVFRDSLNRELVFVQHYFESNHHEPFMELLYGFLLQYMDRYAHNPNTNFLLRTAFFAPLHLKIETIEGGNFFIDHLEQMLLPLFQEAISNKRISETVSQEVAAKAYLAVLDGLFVELLFGNTERALKRVNASWIVYWRGIQKQSEVT